MDYYNSFAIQLGGWNEGSDSPSEPLDIMVDGWFNFDPTDTISTGAAAAGGAISPQPMWLNNVVN